MEEMLIIPKKELPKDVNYFKEELTGNAWLNRAGDLAAKKKRILQDPLLSDEVKVQEVKPISQQLLKANKRLRQIPSLGSAGEKDDEDDDGDDLVSTNIEKWLKRLAKNVQTPRTPASSARRPPPTSRSTLTTLGTPTTSKTPRTVPRRQLPSRPPTTTSSRSSTPRSTTSKIPVPKQVLDDEEEEIYTFTPKKKKKTLTGSILEGAVQGLTGKKETFTPPRTRSKTKGIKTPKWLSFK